MGIMVGVIRTLRGGDGSNVVDQRVGDAYWIVNEVYKNLAYIKQLSESFNEFDINAAAAIAAKDEAEAAAIQTAADRVQTGLDAASIIVATKKFNTYTEQMAYVGAYVDGQKADVLGYYAMGDGGFIPMYWSASSTAVHNGGTVRKPTAVIGAGRWLAVNTSTINVLQFGIKNDGITDNKSSINTILELASALKCTLYFPSGTYILEADGAGIILVGQSNTNVIFDQNAILKFRNSGGYAVTACIDHNNVSNIHYQNIYIDANSISGANAIGASRTSKLTISNARVKNALRSAAVGGGRAITCQFNCQDVHIDSPIIWDCTTAIDFHGNQTNKLYNIVVTNPTISNCEEAMSFYDLADANSNMTLGGDVQVAIVGGSAYNCGLSTSELSILGDASGLNGGVFVSERARSVSITGFTVFNTTAYGKIGGIFRGSWVNCKVSDINAYAEVVAIINLEPAKNLLPVTFSTGAEQLTPRFSDIKFNGTADYAVYHDNGSGITKLYRGVFDDITMTAPIIGFINAIINSNWHWFKFRSLTTGSVVAGFGDDVFANSNTFDVQGVLHESYKSIKSKPLHIKVSGVLDQFKLERTTSNAGTGRLWADSNGTQIGNDAFAAGLRVRTMDSTLDVSLPSHAWDLNRLRLGSYYLWVDSTGDLRIKSSAPTSDTDGTVVGTQT